jgi:hypothetical protein
MSRRLPIVVIAVALAVLLVAGARPAGAAPPGADETALLERYAPVVAVRRQTSACGEGERFLPVAVDAILGRDDVVLRDRDGRVVATAPTATDLASGGADLWIDMPGNTLDPGCAYETWFDTLDAPPAMYGRVTSEQGATVVQYWFFWIYNQWNDVHEGDWEMVQLVFDTATPAEALTASPNTYAYAQHEGSEYASAGENDGKVTLVDGTHPLVFAAEGSHASFFSSSRWFGKSGATGFGCDDTSAPVDQIRPTVIPLPGDDVPTDGPLAWLSFRGHWGEQAPAFDDGPTGPVTKSQWAAPVTWVEDEGRESAVALPFADTRATETFCDLTATGSALFNRLLDRPLLVLAAIALVAVAAVLVVRASSRGVLGRAARTWRANARRLVPVGALVLAGAAASWLVQWMLLRWTSLGTLVDVVGESSPWVLPLVALIGALVAAPVVCWVAASTLAAVSTATDARAALGAPARRRAGWWTTLALVVLSGPMLLGFPILVVLVGRWLVAPVVASRDRARVVDAFRRSNRLVRGHSFRAIGMVVTLLLVASTVGVLGALVLLLTSLTFPAAGIVTALAGVVVVPYLAVVVAEFHDDLAADGSAHVRRGEP